MTRPAPAAHYVEDCGWIVTHTHDAEEARRLIFGAIAADDGGHPVASDLPTPVTTWLRTQPLRHSQQEAAGFRFLYIAPKAAGERGAYPAVEFPTGGTSYPIGLPCQN